MIKYSRRNKILLGIFIPIIAIALTLSVVLPTSFSKRKTTTPASTPSIENGSGVNSVTNAIDNGEIVTESQTNVSKEDWSKKGGSILLEEGSSFVMEEEAVISGHSNVYGGAIFIGNGASFTMNGGEISGNRAKLGGAIYVASGGICIINGGTIKNNSAHVGPAIFVEKGGHLEINETTVIQDNVQGLYEADISIYVDGKIAKNIVSMPNQTLAELEFPKSDEACCGYFLDSEMTIAFEDIANIPFGEMFSSTNSQAFKAVANGEDFGKLSLYTHTATPNKLTFTETANGTYSVQANNTAISGEVVVPRKYQGKLVDKVLDPNQDLVQLLFAEQVDQVQGAFFYCENMTELYVPSSITELGSGFATACPKLKKFNLTNKVTKIGSGAFAMCDAYAWDVSFPETLEAIGSGAYLQSILISGTINIPASVESIGNLAFAMTPGIENIVVDNANTSYTSRNKAGNEIGALIEIASKTLMSGTKAESLANDQSISQISMWAFFGRDSVVGNVTIPDGVERIEMQTFAECNRITGLTIPVGVTYIDDGAFQSCKSLGGVLTLPEGLTNVDDEAFHSTAITEIVFPSSLTAIGPNAFYGCASLKRLEIPDTVTSVGGSAFYGLTALEYFDSGNTLTSLSGIVDFANKTNLKTVILGNKINKIEKRQFENCSNLDSIQFTKAVQIVETSAFISTNKMTKVNFIGSIEDWCKTIFDFCNPLEYAHNLYINGTLVENLVIPETITDIYYYAFCGASCLKTVTLPETIKSIGNQHGGDAFSNCTGLTKVDFLGTMDQWCNIDFGTDSNPLAYAHNFYIQGTLIDQLVLPTSVTALKNYTFIGASCLKNITLHNSLTTIGDYCFDNCTGFTTLELPTSLQSIGSSAFKNCNGLTTLEFPTSLQSIGSSAFASCDALTELTVPGNVQTIGYNAFRYCSGLKKVVLEDGITTLGHNAFEGNIDGDHRSQLEIVVLPNTLTTLYSDVFNYCCEIKFAYFPKAITTVNSYIFKYPFTNQLAIFTDVESESARPSGWNSLWSTRDGSNKHNVVYGASLQDFWDCVNASDNGFVYEGTKLVGYTGSATEINIPAFTTEIGNNVFKDKTFITSVSIPEKVTRIGTSAFNGCSGLTRVDYSGNIEQWCNISFNNYYSNPLCNAHNLYINNNLVENVVIPESVIEIKDCVFYGASCLKSVTMNDKITTIGVSAFDGCSGLTRVDYLGTIEQWCNISFNSYYSNPLYYAHNLYINNELVENVVIPDSVTEIKKNIFNGASCLKSVTLHDKITKIGESAFNECMGLTGPLTIPDSVTTIGSSAFQSCYGLTGALTIPDSVTSIGSAAFLNCIELKSVTIPSSVTTIDGRAFRGCTKLTSAYIPKTVTTMKPTFVSYAPFFYCTSTCEIYTDVVDEATATTQWGKFWNNYSDTSKLTVHYGVSREQYDAMIQGFQYEGTKLVGYTGTATEINIPSFTTEIRDSVFANNTAMTKVSIPANVTKVGTSAFHGCTALTGVYISDLASFFNIDYSDTTLVGIQISDPLYYAHNLYLNNTLVTDLVIPSGVTKVNRALFRNATCLTSVRFPASVQTVDTAAFTGCTNIAKVYVDDLASFCQIDFNTLYPLNGTNPLIYANGLYVEENKITKLVVPASVTAIGKSAFWGYKDLEEVSFAGSSATKIGDYAFYNCLNLSKFTMPSSMVEIGAMAFNSCDNLSRIYIPLSVTVMKSYGSDTNLKTPFPTSTEVYCEAPERPSTWEISMGSWHYGVSREFYDSMSQGFVYNGTVLTEYSGTATDLVIPSGVTELGESVFYRKSYNSITIPSTVKKIGSDAFYQCSITQKLTIPEGVEEIGATAFQYCGGLSGALVIPSSVKSIGDGAFFGTSLTSVYLPSTVVTVSGDPSNHSSPFYGTHIEIYTDLTETQTVPSGWGEEWAGGCTVHYGYTLAQYKSEFSL